MSSITAAKEIIQVNNLEVVYPGGIKAVDGISFAVQEQEIFGLLGPNGAGKTTTILVLTTLLHPTAGSAFIDGLNVCRRTNEVRMKLGYVSQDLAVDDELSGWDNLWMQAGLFNMDRSIRKERLEEVLELVGLSDRARDRVSTYSGGMRKRLDIACGLIHRPKLLILDEPTLGLDIQTRHEIWRYVARLQEEIKMTILLTTHYMDEADALCNRIAIIDRGKLMALDTPRNLKEQLGGDLIIFSFAPGTDAGAVNRDLNALKEQPFVLQLTEKNGEYVIITSRGEENLPLFFSCLESLAVRPAKVTLKVPSLDDVFLYHTGRDLRDAHASAGEVYRSRLTIRRIRGKH